MPADPPVAVRGQTFDRAQLTLSGVDDQGRAVQLPKGLTVEAHLRPPQQLDPAIESLGKTLEDVVCGPIGASWRRNATEERTQWLIQWGDKEEALLDALYAFRYHQRQFFSRLRIVTSHYTFAYDAKHAADDTTIRFSDGPLEYELASVLIRTSSVLDALAKQVGFLWKSGAKNWAGWRKELDKKHDVRQKERAALRRLLNYNDRWLTTNLLLRNAIVHEAKFPGFRSVGHVGGEMLDAEVEGVPAGGLVTRTWIGLKELIPAVVEIVGEVAVRPE